ncbi:MAG: hypothetical protein ACLT1X_09120 [Christensenellales bacterium]
MTKQKAYVQFSKRIVLLVTIAVTLISLLAMVLCFFRSDTEALVSYGSDVHQLRDDCFRSVQRQLGVREVADAGEER